MVSQSNHALRDTTSIEEPDGSYLMTVPSARGFDKLTTRATRRSTHTPQSAAGNRRIVNSMTSPGRSNQLSMDVQ